MIELEIKELKDLLWDTHMEIESTKKNATEKIAENGKIVEQLLKLMKALHKERDEAIYLFQRLTNPIGSNDFHKIRIPNPIPILPKIIPNPIVSDSRIVATTHNSQFKYLPNFSSTSTVAETSASRKGKQIADTGKLLHAVEKSGPLIQTPLLEGIPIPRWKNPTINYYNEPTSSYFVSDAFGRGSTKKKLAEVDSVSNVMQSTSSSSADVAPSSCGIPLNVQSSYVNEYRHGSKSSCSSYKFLN